MKYRILETQTLIRETREVVFDFFSKAENLNKLTPDDLEFKILTPQPIEMGKGTLIEYQLKLLSFPFYWQTEITHWEPPFRFVDTQLKGPYRRWVHEHTFLEKENQTLMIDKVEFLSPGWFAEPFIHRLFVKNRVEAIFKFREKVITDLFKN